MEELKYSAITHKIIGAAWEISSRKLFTNWLWQLNVSWLGYHLSGNRR